MILFQKSLIKVNIHVPFHSESNISYLDICRPFVLRRSKDSTKVIFVVDISNEKHRKSLFHAITVNFLVTYKTCVPPRFFNLKLRNQTLKEFNNIAQLYFSTYSQSHIKVTNCVQIDDGICHRVIPSCNSFSLMFSTKITGPRPNQLII